VVLLRYQRERRKDERLAFLITSESRRSAEHCSLYYAQNVLYDGRQRGNVLFAARFTQIT
jgi:ribosomal protein L35AE/L33A